MSITIPATAAARLDGPAMTGTLLLLRTAGLAATSIQAHTSAPSAAAARPPAR